MSGGSGFLGGCCVVELLRQGYRVRTTVRDLAKEPELRARIATRVDPGDRLSVHAFMVRAMGVFDPSVRSVARQLGQRVELSSEKARAELGWQPRPVEETIADCARSLIGERVG